MKFRKKPVVIEAIRWFQNGDHPEDACYYVDDKSPDRFLSEGKVVRRFCRPDVPSESHCKHCTLLMGSHGWIDTLEGGHIVCPGDWVITGVAGERYPCKPDIFRATYEEVEMAETTV